MGLSQLPNDNSVRRPTKPKSKKPSSNMYCPGLPTYLGRRVKMLACLLAGWLAGWRALQASRKRVSEWFPTTYLPFPVSSELDDFRRTCSLSAMRSSSIIASAKYVSVG